MAAKTKVDFTDRDNLQIAEGLARDGLDNKDIAAYFNYARTYFSELLQTIPELSDAVRRGRKPLSVKVETSLYRRAIGGIKVKTVTRRFLEQDCMCGGKIGCEECGGTGKIVSATKSIVQESESELPPDVGAAALWLKQKKPEIWNNHPNHFDQNSGGMELHSVIEIIDRTGLV